ncbi:MAG: tetratricopeptide repeat protein [Anaerolineae bacterium]|nr:tetratricopeptide repeat protein [Anaerolineae bacterium]
MSDSNTDALKRAYELVEAGQPEEARAILNALLASDPRNPDAWWIYAYAVDDPVEAQHALNTVLQLDPDYPEATQLLESLQEQYPQLIEAQTVESLAEGDIPPLPADIPLGDETDSLLESDDSPEFLPPPATAIPEPPTMRAKKGKRGNWPVWIALIAALLLVLLVALILPRGETPTTTAGLATFTPVPVDATATGVQVILEVSPLAVGETEEAGLQATLPVEIAATTSVETTVVLQVTPLDAVSADLTATAGAVVVTPEVLATEDTSGGEAQPTSESGNVIVLQVTPFDAAATEQATAAVGEVEQTSQIETEAAGDPNGNGGTLLPEQSVTSETTTEVIAATAEGETATPIAETAEATTAEATVETGVEVIDDEATPTAETFVVEATLTETTDEAGGGESTEPAPTVAPGQEVGGELTGLQSLEQSLTEAGIANYAITGLVTEPGNALIVSVCAEEGPELRAILMPVMSVAARNAAGQDARFGAVGVEVLSCSNPRQTLRLIIVERPVAEDYANGSITEEEFQSTWMSL